MFWQSNCHLGQIELKFSSEGSLFVVVVVVVVVGSIPYHTAKIHPKNNTEEIILSTTAKREKEKEKKWRKKCEKRNKFNAGREEPENGEEKNERKK